jgi:hypothetical protein
MRTTEEWAGALLMAASLSAQAELLTVHTARNRSWVAVETTAGLANGDLAARARSFTVQVACCP